MRPFDEILELAARRQGGMSALKRALAETLPLPKSKIAAISDDRILAAMTRRVFYAGFSSKVVDKKWDAFETVFEAFEPARCAFMTDERLGALLNDKGIVETARRLNPFN